MIWQGSRTPGGAAEPNPLEKFRRVAAIPPAITAKGDGPGEQPSCSKKPRRAHATLDSSDHVPEDMGATSNERETGVGTENWRDDIMCKMSDLKSGVEGFLQYQRTLEEDLRGERGDRHRLHEELGVLQERLY